MLKCINLLIVAFKIFTMGYYFLPMNNTVELASNIVISTFENTNLVSLKTRFTCLNELWKSF